MAEPSRERKATRLLGRLGSIAGNRLVIALAAVVVSSFVVSTVLLPRTVVLEVGSPAKRDIQAHRSIVNRLATQRLQDEARRTFLRNAPSSAANYQINPAFSYVAEESVEEVFDAIEAARADAASSTTNAAQGAEQRLREAGGLSISWEDLVQFIAMDEPLFKQARETAVSLVGNTMRNVRITEANIPSVASGIPEDLSRLGLPEDVIKPVSRVVVAALTPNLSLDLGLVERAAEEQASRVQPVYIQKGQSVIRKGDPATEEHIAILTDLGVLGSRGSIKVWLGIFAVTAAAIGYSALYIRTFSPHASSSRSALVLISVTGIITLATASVLAEVAPDAAPHLVPVAFTAMVISSLLSLEMALVANVTVSILVGFLLHGDMFAALTALMAGAAGAYSVPGSRDRASMTRAVVSVSAAAVATSVFYGFAFGQPEIVGRWYLGIVNGIISTVMTLGSLPFFEAIFGVTSPLRLLELANPGHPLLRRLLLEAPGTYHHSILVGNLAETGAQAVGADALLVRVGALYHDCGKLRRPYFFSENQFTQGNPHDRINPSLSTLIITSHVKDGVDLARQYRLPMPVVDVIQQHHGTSLVSFFYYRATESEKDLCVEEKDFRYPGPKPQTKEAAIVMLADSTEAAVRALAEPSPWQVNSVVRKIIRERLTDGQLDECNLTLRDLHVIESAFMDVLSGVYHERVEYPDLLPKETREAEGRKIVLDSGDSEPAAESADRGTS
ncbi:MAG: HDIG domain-containing protein [Firmicutes bacterium]|jgi:putative nucleotidyltransferase with HDIG domain|nr:HDIG domain-containing protein [Bacillota bacterium]